MDSIRRTSVNYAPPMDKTLIWIDVSGEKPVQKVYLEGKWVAMKDAGVVSYTELDSKPTINNITINGNMTGENLNLVNMPNKEEITADGKVTLDVALNTLYIISGNLTELDINSVDNTYPLASFIVFTSSSTATTLQYPESSISWINDTIPTIEANTRYIIGILNNIAYISEIAMDASIQY